MCIRDSFGDRAQGKIGFNDAECHIVCSSF
jgi:hypothetical protein